MKPSVHRDLRKGLVSSLQGLGRTHDTRKVFEDWVEIMAISFANVPGNGYEALRDDVWKAREARYLALVEKYGRDDFLHFPRMLALLIELIQDSGGDPLGELYEELGASNHKDWAQLFTPWEVCQTMTRMTLVEADVGSLIERQGFITVNDPACGGGRTLLAASQALLELGFNPQTQAWFMGQDVSASAVHMAVANLSIRGLPAALVQGDTLRMEAKSVWYTPAHVMGLWSRKAGRGQKRVEVPSHGQLPLSQLEAAEAQAFDLAAKVCRVEEQAVELARIFSLIAPADVPSGT